MSKISQNSDLSSLNEPNSPYVTPGCEKNSFETNINTLRGSRVQAPDDSLLINGDCDYALELRAFKYQVIKKMDMQTRAIMDLRDLCISLKSELQEIKTKFMSVVEQSDKSNSENINRALNVNNGQCIRTEDISEKRIENIPTPTFAKITQNPRQVGGSTSEATKATKISSATIKTRRVKRHQLQSVDLETVEVSVKEADEPLVLVDPYHPPLLIELDYPRYTRIGRDVLHNWESRTAAGRSKLTWNFYKADFASLYHSLSLVDWGDVYNMRNPEHALAALYDILNNILDKHVPRKSNAKNHKCSYPEWYTSDIINDIRLKAKLHKRYKLSRSDTDYNAFAFCRRRVKANLKQTFQIYEQRIQNNLIKDPKSFWKYIGAKKSSAQKQTVYKNGVQLSNSECANEFAKYFYSVYNNEPARLNVDEAVRASGGGSARVHVPELSLAEVKVALVRLKPKSSVGPDGIPPFLLRDCRKHVKYKRDSPHQLLVGGTAPSAHQEVVYPASSSDGLNSN
ncbi:unnamed protein product [Leptosia nina]|uniref:Uncharacterized protein n=1 Tax=Leptosia nina TaxID=320188 RepID=A0AAV1JJW6_9NEOP